MDMPFMKNTDSLCIFLQYHLFHYGGCQYICTVVKYTDTIMSMAGHEIIDLRIQQSQKRNHSDLYIFLRFDKRTSLSYHGETESCNPTHSDPILPRNGLKTF